MAVESTDSAIGKTRGDDSQGFEDRVSFHTRIVPNGGVTFSVGCRNLWLQQYFLLGAFGDRR